MTFELESPTTARLVDVIERRRLLGVRKHMIDRCTKPEHRYFAYYGGRGITVCDRWLNSAQAFLDDVQPRPPGLTLERPDNSKGYGPDNFRWATRAEQVRNRRNNVIVEINGERMVLKDAADRLGMHYDTLWSRMRRRGQSLESAIAVTVRHNALTPDRAAWIRSQLKAGRRQCDVARELGVSQGAVSDVSLGKTYIGVHHV